MTGVKCFPMMPYPPISCMRIKTKLFTDSFVPHPQTLVNNVSNILKKVFNDFEFLDLINCINFEMIKF